MARQGGRSPCFSREVIDGAMPDRVDRGEFSCVFKGVFFVVVGAVERAFSTIFSSSQHAFVENDNSRVDGLSLGYGTLNEVKIYDVVALRLRSRLS